MLLKSGIMERYLNLCFVWKKMTLLKVKLNFEAIIRSEMFFRNILGAAELSGTKESSFNLYCNHGKLYFTKPLEEQCGYARRSTTKEGVVYDLKGFGLHLPEGAESVISTHFHPRTNTAVPSEDDLKRLLSLVNSNVLECENKPIYPIDVAGHQERRGGEIKLHFYQYTFRVDCFNPNPAHKYLPERLCSGIVQLLANKYGELDFSDKNLSEKAAEILNQSEKIRAAVITFKTREEYDSELQKLNNFDLFLRK